MITPSSYSAMALSQANRFLDSIMGDIRKIFFKGKTPISGFGLEIVSKIHIMKDIKVNAEQWVKQNKKGIMQNGVSVTSGLLQIRDNNSIKFAILHEMGHLLTMQFTKTFKLKLSMIQLEVIADLSSVFLMKRSGLSWGQIERAVMGWKYVHIFDAKWSGAHPPGNDRTKIIKRFIKLSKSGFTFKNAVKKIIKATTKYKNGDRLPRLP